MPFARTASALVHLASLYPVGSEGWRRCLTAARKTYRDVPPLQADVLARIDFLAGYMGHTSNTKVMRMYLKYGRNQGKIQKARVQLLKEGKIRPDDVPEALADIGIFSPLLDALVEAGISWDAAREFVDPKRNFHFREALVKGVNSALGRAVDSIAESQPALKGISGEDLAQVLGFGGLLMPGMIFDNNINSGVPGLRGGYKERENAAYKKGTSIWTSVGKQAKGKPFKKLGSLVGYIKKTGMGDARKKTIDWIRSVDAGRTVQFQTDEEGQVLEDFGGYEPPASEELLTGAKWIKRIDRDMRRALSGAPSQQRIWDALVASLSQGKSFLQHVEKGSNKPNQRGRGELTVKSRDLAKFMKGWLEKQRADEQRKGTSEEDALEMFPEAPSEQNIGKNFRKFVPKMVKLVEKARGGEGSGSMADVVRQRDLMQVMREEQSRGRRAALRTAMHRQAMIKLAASYPKGSKERRSLLAALTQSRPKQGGLMPRPTDLWFVKLKVNLRCLGNPRCNPARWDWDRLLDVSEKDGESVEVFDVKKLG
jgi:hypothetical protein